MTMMQMPKVIPSPARCNSSWVETVSGRRVWPCDPRPEDFEIEDIAHALSNICRFTGHTRKFYSVAQHSVIVSRNVPDELALAALLHDGSESVLADVSRPVKPHLSNYKSLELGVMNAIGQRFGITIAALNHPLVKLADERALVTERRDLMGPAVHSWGPLDELKPFPKTIVPMNPEDARYQFLRRFNHLTKRR